MISIITITKNAGRDLERTLQSILSQRYPHIQSIVIDSASTDQSAQILQKYRDKLAYCISEPDDGIYYAMNKGLEQVRGQWLNFMNAGDTFRDEDSVQQFIDLADNQYSLAYSDLFIQTSNQLHYKKQGGLYRYGWYWNACHQSIFYNIQKLQGIKYDTQYAISADFDLLLRLLVQCPDHYCYQKINKALVVYQGGGISEQWAYQALLERELQFRSHLHHPTLRYWNLLNLQRQKLKRRLRTWLKKS